MKKTVFTKRLSMAIACASLLFSACATSSGSLITSFRDMTSEVDQGGRKMGQNRIFSVNGSMPQAEVGQILRFDADRGVSTAFGLTTGESYMQRKTVEPEGDLKCIVKKVREAILKARTAGTSYIAKRMKLLKAEVEEAERSAAAAGDQPTSSSADLNALRLDVDNARAWLDDLLLDANDVIEDSGVLVVRWDAETEKSGSLLTYFNLTGTKSESIGGYLIIAGVRETTLFVGNDIDQLNPGLQEAWDWWVLKRGWFPWFGEMRYPAHVRVTTHMLQGRHIMFLQDSKSSASLDFDFEYQWDDSTSVRTILESGKVEIQLAMRKVSSLSNMGYLADPVWTRVPLLQEKRAAEGSSEMLTQSGWVPNEEKKAAPCKADSGWTTLYAVDTDFLQLTDLFHKRK